MGRGPEAVIAVGDSAAAAGALNAATSSVPQMSRLTRATRLTLQQWLGVAVPREWNVDADRLSHPSQRDRVAADARAAGLEVTCLWDAIPDRCWTTLREAMADATHGLP